MIVLYSVRITFVCYVLSYLVHRARSIQRYSGYYIFEIARTQISHKFLHTFAFELEHGVRIAFADKLVYLRIVILHIIKVEVDAFVLLNVFYGFIYVGKRS